MCIKNWNVIVKYMNFYDYWFWRFFFLSKIVFVKNNEENNKCIIWFNFYLDVIECNI